MSAADSQHFQGRVALVTGAAGGLGSAVATSLQRHGCDVWSADRAFTREGPRTCRLDVASYAEVHALVARIERESGRLDLLVNAAGFTRPTPFLQLDPASWDELIGVHLSGTFYTCRAAAGGMVSRGYGRILNFSSIAGLSGPIDAAHYGAAKAGIAGLTRAIATELAESGITANAIAPGPVMTQILRDAWKPDALAARHEQVPARRLGAIDEIVHACLFLLSEQASYVNGITMPVDGGATAAGAYLPEIYRRRCLA